MTIRIGRSIRGRSMRRVIGRRRGGGGVHGHGDGGGAAGGPVAIGFVVAAVCVVAWRGGGRIVRIGRVDLGWVAGACPWIGAAVAGGWEVVSIRGWCGCGTAEREGRDLGGAGARRPVSVRGAPHLAFSA